MIVATLQLVLFCLFCLAETATSSPFSTPTSTTTSSPTPSPSSRAGTASQSKAAATVILNIIAYAPIALYAESLRVASALVRSICGRVCAHSPVTGCIKDLASLWNLRPQDLFEVPTFGQSQPGRQVVSLRHGIQFPLVNAAVLQNSALVGRGLQSGRNKTPAPATGEGIDRTSYRQTVVNVTFLTPQRDRPKRASHSWSPYAVTALELLILLSVASFLAFKQLYLGAIVLMCLFTTTTLIIVLQHFSTPIIASKKAIDQDTSKTAANGAAIDVHVIATNWNSSELDVLLGYSSQIHALTNIPMTTSAPGMLLAVARVLAIVLVAQAALLAALASGNDDKDTAGMDNQAWGSLAWLACYLLMQLPPRVFNPQLIDSMLDTQPIVPTRVQSSLVFSGRREALCFIACLPSSLRDTVGQWDWVDGFMPPNARRVEWEGLAGRIRERIHASSQLKDGGLEGNIGGEWEEGAFQRIKGVFEEGGFRDALMRFRSEAGLE